VDRPRRRELPLWQAVALGLLHGPSELLPISSSAHTTLVPWLLDWGYGELDPRLRKSFEVALHAGTAVGLLTRPPWLGSAGSPQVEMGGVRAQARACLGVPRERERLLALSGALAGAIGPPALAGYLLGERIERRLGTPGTIAVGLLGGALAMAAAERLSGDARAAERAGPGDGLALGAAQTLALAPGLSRSGLTTAAARLRGFRRADADRLSWQAGLPVIAGATLLKGLRQARAGAQTDQRRAILVGGAAAFASTRLSTRLLPAERRLRLLWPTIAYRVLLAGLVGARMARMGRSRAGRPER
jgi:undecaprenyl-diphosphatase